MNKLFELFLILSFCLYGCGGKTRSAEKQEVAPQNGDLNNTFIEPVTEPKLTPEQIFQKEKEKLLSEGWSEPEIQNGQLPSCYNFKPRKGKVKNYLDVSVGRNTDVSIKVMNTETDKCVRYVFINGGTTFRINNIPEGQYYLKIAYGKNWLSKVENGQCIGKFIRNSMYEKGQDIMDFNIQYNANSYNIPSYSLELDVISNASFNSFNSQNISETEFNL